MKLRIRPEILLVVIAFLGFISLGLPDGVLGVANPSIRETFQISLDDIKWLFVSATTGYLISSALSAPIVARIGVGRLLALSCFITGLALTGYTLAPAWIWIVLLGVFAGAGGGAIDAGINTYVDANYPPALMFWLHAFYGVGTTLGPLIMTTVLSLDASWRWGYAIIAGLQFSLALTFFLTADRWKTGKQTKTSTDAPESEHLPHVPLTQTLRLPAVWLGIAIFFLYTGVEVTAGQFSYTLLTEARGIAPETAGIWLSVYWGMFTFGRIAAGFISRYLDTITFLRISMIGAVFAAGLFWWNPFPIANVIALGVIGFAFAPTFPALISSTVERVGERHIANSIGFQVSAAAIGGAVLPAITATFSATISLQMIAVILVIANVMILILHEVILRMRAPVNA
ncbi:MAG: MFS transporter [Anaerolineae bacterium]|jgi:fucose permease|nr:MFS transporter [Anaerolineae bacterium]